MVTNASSTAALSSPASIQWKPMTVSVTASPENPESGDVSKRTVTLTAMTDGPSGVTYQWQLGSGSAWVNLGASTTSATKTVSLTTRGTREFRVQVSHSVVPSAESQPVYVTWDEWSIVLDLLAALHATTTTDTPYTTAQATLLSCMNATQGNASSTPNYASFDDILNSYTGDTKTKMEVTCSTGSAAMFDVLRTLSPTKLASLQSGTSATSTLYAALLDTPHGRYFEQTVGDATTSSSSSPFWQLLRASTRRRW